VASPSKTPPERLAAFSDGVFAVLITIMILDLRPPHEFNFHAVVQLWPMVLSYAVSYLFIAIVWVNHHHLLRFAEDATPGLIWWNFVHLFLVSFVPFSTAWVADTHFAGATVTVYAFVFVLVDGAYYAFQNETMRQAEMRALPAKVLKATQRRACLTLGGFVLAGVIAFKYPLLGFAMICGTLVAFIRPELNVE